ncbi:MAG: hypothetical protein ABI807_15570 [Sporichthyaceae bacterium]
MTADPGADPVELPEVREYLERLRAEGWHLPPDRLEEMVDDVRAHVREAVAAGVAAGDDAGVAARNALERLGAPAEIVRAEAEQSGVPTGPEPVPARPGAMVRYGEPVAIFLLMFGAFLLVVGWLVGVLLLWLSPSWRLREKALGTLVWPFGYLGVGLAAGLVTYTESCVSTGTAAGGADITTCTGGPPYPGWVGVLIGIGVLVAPVAVAAVLWRRRQAVLDGRAA